MQREKREPDKGGGKSVRVAVIGEIAHPEETCVRGPLGQRVRKRQGDERDRDTEPDTYDKA